MKAPYRPLIRVAAEAHALDPALIEAIIWQESNGRADGYRYEPAFWERYCRESPRWRLWEPRRVAASYGLMQVMFTTAVQFGYEGDPEGLFLIPTNLEFGCRVLRNLAARWPDDLGSVLAAYNGGPGGIGRAAPRYYARQVLARLAHARPHWESVHGSDATGDPIRA